MPGSYGIFDDVVREIMRVAAPATFLDIGTGSGKYGKMARETIPACRRTGLEMEASYIEQFNLRELYHEMRNMDASQLMKSSHEEVFDLVVIGDCIEHMPKSVGLDLLNFLTYRTKYMVVLAPEFCVQGATGGVGSESHVSVWSEYDFQWHDAWAHEYALTVNMFLLRGYQTSEMPLSVLVDGVNRAAVNVMDFNREQHVRSAHLTPYIRRRIEVLHGIEQNFRMK